MSEKNDLLKCFIYYMKMKIFLLYVLISKLVKKFYYVFKILENIKWYWVVDIIILIKYILNYMCNIFFINYMYKVKF